ncbi:putative inactive peptidyl-prolyl cis-trans isomerase-like 6 [Dinochytrium kinnereticum]|nr:putative inactive peptidyl-prolyl cis-trans isomerase-like 6 [Dinochytrium kinnereticum]
MPPLVFEPPSISFEQALGHQSYHGATGSSEEHGGSPISVRVNVKVFGILKSAGYQRAKHIVEGLVQNVADVFSAEFYPFNAFDYFETRNSIKRDFINLVDTIFPDVFILASTSPKPTVQPKPKITGIPDIFEHKKRQEVALAESVDLGPVAKYEAKPVPSLEKLKGCALLTCDRFVEWIRGTFALHVRELGEEDGEETYAARAEAEFTRELGLVSHKFVYIDVKIDEVFVGRIIAQIYTDIVPITAAHFMGFVEGTNKHPTNDGEKLCYSGTKVTRAIKGGWIQAGDENFIIEHKHRGQLSMVNYGPHSNYSQFMITLKPMAYFDRKFVSIGRCIDGHGVLDAIEAVETQFERPLRDIEFSDVGEVRE